MGMTVLIVDDHPSFRASARELLEAEGYEIVGEAENGAAALQAVQELHPGLQRRQGRRRHPGRGGLIPGAGRPRRHQGRHLPGRVRRQARRVGQLG